jgi:hypothetical protein
MIGPLPPVAPKSWMKSVPTFNSACCQHQAKVVSPMASIYLHEIDERAPVRIVRIYSSLQCDDCLVILAEIQMNLCEKVAEFRCGTLLLIMWKLVKVTEGSRVVTHEIMRITQAQPFKIWT